MSSTTIKPYFELIAQSTPKRRKKLLKVINRGELEGLCEICLNILKGNINLNTEQINALKKNKKLIRQLSNRQISQTQKKDIINQNGGFIASLASIVLPMLTSLFTK